MLYNLRTKLNKQWFNLRARGILDTPAVKRDPSSPVVVLTMLHHPDVMMYLVAAKSFCRFLRPGRFVVADDGLQDSDRALLRTHFEGIEFLPTSQSRSDRTPRGGCWERLLTIADLNDRHYVIQLDADTVTVNRPDEVLDCVLQSRSFTLGTQGGSAIISCREASQIASGWQGSHVQVLAEQALVKLPAALGTQYVHGCAGFAGFRPGSITRGRVEEVSEAFARCVAPAKWAEWGSEQVTSNFLVANTPNAVVLPPSIYPFWAPGVRTDTARLIHFFGTHRFEGGKYRHSALEVISDLNSMR